MDTGQLENILLLQVLVTDLHQRRPQISMPRGTPFSIRFVYRFLIELGYQLGPSEPNLALTDYRLVKFFGFSANKNFGCPSDEPLPAFE